VLLPQRPLTITTQTRSTILFNPHSFVQLAVTGLLPIVSALQQLIGQVPCCCAVQVDELRGSPLSVGTLEEIIDEK
jgi:hypothetical protein